MTPSKYIGHDAFRVSISNRFPPEGCQAFAKWMQHSDGTVLLYIRGPFIGAAGAGSQILDAEAREAFGTENVCHACVGVFSYGQITRTSEKVSWLRAERLDYQERFGTTDRRGQRIRWGVLCEPCRLHFASKATDNFIKELRDLGFGDTVIAGILESNAMRVLSDLAIHAGDE